MIKRPHIGIEALCPFRFAFVPQEAEIGQGVGDHFLGQIALAARGKSLREIALELSVPYRGVRCKYSETEEYRK